MNVVAQAVHEFVTTNPGMTSKAVAVAMTPYCNDRGIKPQSIQAYLSILKSAGLVKVKYNKEAPRAPATFHSDRKWDANAYRKAAEPKGISTGRTSRGVPRRVAQPPRPNRTLRMLLDQHGPAAVISAFQTELLAYGRDNSAWIESMTEQVTEVFESAFDVLQDTMKLAE